MSGKKDLAIELGQKIYSNTIEGLKEKLQAEREKVVKLLDLMLLTDPVVSSVIVGDTQIKQHQEFLRTFPDEREKLEARE